MSLIFLSSFLSFPGEFLAKQDSDDTLDNRLLSIYTIFICKKRPGCASNSIGSVSIYDRHVA